MVGRFQWYSISTSNRSRFTARVPKAAFLLTRKTRRDPRLIVRAARWFASRLSPSGWRPDDRIASRRPSETRGIRVKAPAFLSDWDASRHLGPTSLLSLSPAGPQREISHWRYRFSLVPQPDIPMEKRRVARRTGRAFFSGSRIRVDMCA